ncbi:threonine/homoserine exporter RhtA [Rouxiella badensis]|uniref:threonine/homoserine exporter RhtA n=1 Tax=Rouxiella badensis TaxID=1646377 RepID=UPI000369E740|nr:threonine/homoserine exporter RhtA [Rouxiella badensis]MCC3701053.1 threonine/homoserine exporter RhtA [Rouxiella badensis]MCC3717480.1 threonine/homoserine exporter RhtA [Rouxiella badensis]MCC3727576.1 threonine/homoserine exporter RhtA [Rouxiella badensis]MCC3732480.1 threonine/homoserine exporter RhtA [Rouxiella badensis]MCC3740408.1 threonine/homoserine exporter RhtA [Rouxiella badensis]
MKNNSLKNQSGQLLTDTVSPAAAKAHNPLIAVAMILIAMLSLQGGAAMAKSLFPLVGSQGVTALRLGMGSIILLCYFRPWRIKMRGGNLRSLLIYGLALGCMNYTFYLAIRTVPLGIAVALEFTGPLAVAMFSSRRPIDFVWVLLAVIGLGFLLPIGHSVTGIDPVGAGFALIAGACWAVYILAGQHAGSSYGPGTAALGSSIGALIFCPIGIAQAHSGLFSLDILPIGLGIALLSSAVPYSLEMMALTRLPAKTFGTLMSMEPAMAAFSGILFLDEILNPMQWLALVAIIAASAGSTLTVQKRAKIRAIKVDPQ